MIEKGKDMSEKEDEECLVMGLGKQKKILSFDLNVEAEESFSELGFQDTAHQIMGFESDFDFCGTGSSSTCPRVELTKRRKYTIEEKAKGKVDDYDDNSVLKLDLDLNLSLGVFGMSNSEPVEKIVQIEELDVPREAAEVVNQEPSRKQRSIAKTVAERFAHPEQQHKEGIKRKLSEVDKESDDFQSPFSLAMKLVKKRNLSQNLNKKSLLGLSDSLIKWVPTENSVSNRNVPNLVDLCLSVLAVNAGKIVSLENVPDNLRHKLSKMVSSCRKMDAYFVGLLARDSPTEIRVWDTSQLTEDDCTNIFCSCDTVNLKVLQLDLCGLCMPEYVLDRILAGPLCRLNKLVTISLKGAHRLSDAGLNALTKSAPGLLSINLSQCALLTSDGINNLATHMESTLRELYIDDCQTINVMLILPALKKFKHLEVLSVAGIPTVRDDFVIGLVEACGMNMKELVLANCLDLTDKSLNFVGKTCPKLCALDLSHLQNLTDSALQYLANGCRSICKLKLCRNDFSDEAIAAFLEASGMSLIELSLNKISKVTVSTGAPNGVCNKLKKWRSNKDVVVIIYLAWMN
ncbi:uncharacterized protein LOC8270077 isoform X2 [Ricinus communis]|uniref:uncharacterized protein LOC8270077 isoform X2 n=1 Tax=Ricinus communis TaxID=3988 RepID=UPI00201A42C8|nr:uncharacterized protein LOC8270077 isoform X2 [Ricinus communis]